MYNTLKDKTDNEKNSNIPYYFNKLKDKIINEKDSNKHDTSYDFNDLTNDQQDFIILFFKILFKEQKAINYNHTAYGLKQSCTGKFFYVTQEQFAKGMEKAGFTCEEKKIIDIF